MCKWNKNTYEKYLKQGKGQGDMQTYRPWINVQDFSSNGTVSRIYGHTTKRVHHFLSRNELAYFYLLEWSDEVLDIREQYPLLDYERAISKANEAGIKYPYDRQSGFPYILTCDFMITTKNGLKARTIKNSEELDKPRVLEKLEIERRYWKDLHIDWRIVTEKEISYVKSKNIEMIHTSTFLPDSLNKIEYKKMLRDEFDCKSIYDIASDFDRKYGLEPGSGMLIIKHLIWTKVIVINMTENIFSC